MCAKDDLVRRKGLLLISTQTSNHVNTFSLDFAFSFANILSLIAFIISYRLFADELVYALNKATVVLIIILVDKTQLLLISEDRSTPSTLLARFIPITKIRNSLLKTNYEEQVLLTSIKKNRYCTRCTKHYNFNIYVSLATDTLHLLLKGLVIKMLDFMQDMLDDIYPKQKAIIQQLIAVVSLLFVLKAPFALHFIRAVCDLVILAQYKSYDEDTLAYIQGALERINHALTYIIQDIRIYRALDSICTRANSEAYHITILILEIQPYLIKLPLSKVAVNIAISNFIHAAAVFRSSSKRYNDSKYCDEEVLYLILTIIDYTCYDKDRKHIAYIGAFSKVLLFNNNRQIDNTTRMLSVPFKFYDLSTIIRLVHLVPRDLPNLITYTTISYYVNNYID
ncbi:hypothetical protein HBI31_243670 [Parastagonospora nodorum]|nr:hypothetical protein HBI31_243670 [Parastagonospora nodorum]